MCRDKITWIRSYASAADYVLMSKQIFSIWAFLKKFNFFLLIKNMYIHDYTYLDYLSNFTPILTKVSIPTFHSLLQFEFITFYKSYQFLQCLPRQSKTELYQSRNISFKFLCIYIYNIYTSIILAQHPRSSKAQHVF